MRRCAMMLLLMLMKFVVVVMVVAPVVRVRGSGLGPVGVMPVYGGDTRHVLVADKHQNALLLVDTHTTYPHAARSRRTFDATERWIEKDAATWPDLVAVGSCADCSYAWVSSNEDAMMWRVQYAEPIAMRLQSTTESPVDLLEQAVLEGFPNRDMQKGPRIIVVDSNDRHRAYVADYRLGAIFVFDPEQDMQPYTQRRSNENAGRLRMDTLLPVTEATSLHVLPPLPWAHTSKHSDGIGGGTKLLVTPAFGSMFVLDAASGTVDGAITTCDDHELVEHNRAAVYDPQTKQVYLLTHIGQRGAAVLATSVTLAQGPRPHTHLRQLIQRPKHERGLSSSGSSGHNADGQQQSKFATAARPWLNTPEFGHGQCTHLFGDASSGSGWLDVGPGEGASAHFSRPHHMELMPAPTRSLVITDIDNRGLRLAHLAGHPEEGAVSSIVYSGPQRLLVTPPADRGDKSSEARHSNKKKWIPLHYHSHKNTNVIFNSSSSSSSSVNKNQNHNRKQEWMAAQARCAKQAERLCAPGELQQGLLSEARSGRHESHGRFWSNLRCASCWISSDVFYGIGQWDRCRYAEDVSKHPLSDIPVVAKTNTRRPAVWNSGHATVRLVQRWDSANSSPAVVVECTRDGELHAARCCHTAR